MTSEITMQMSSDSFGRLGGLQVTDYTGNRLQVASCSNGNVSAQYQAI